MTERNRRRQWIGLLLAAAGMGAATVIVPPLIAPRHQDKPEGAAPPSSSSAPFRSATVPAQFVPIAIQAEDPANKLTGGASAVACSTCRGGRRVRYLCPACALEVTFALPVAGSRKVTVWYEVDGPRSLKVSINGGSARSFPVDGPDWSTPRSFDFTAELQAGQVRIKLYNDDSPAPDLDEIAISSA